HAPADLDARTAFVRLMSGGGDWDALPDALEREHARWGEAIRSGRAGSLPGNELLRVRTTERLLNEHSEAHAVPPGLRKPGTQPRPRRAARPVLRGDRGGGRRPRRRGGRSLLPAGR